MGKSIDRSRIYRWYNSNISSCTRRNDSQNTSTYIFCHNHSHSFEKFVFKSTVFLLDICFFFVFVANICLSGASDGIVAITNLVQGCLLRLINEHSGTIPICMIDSKRINEKNLFYWLITRHDRRGSVWKSHDLQFRLRSLLDCLIFSSPDSKIDWQLNPPSLASFLDDKSILYSGYGLDKTFQIYNIHTKEILRKLSLNHWCYSFDIVNDLIAFGTNERIIQLKDYTQETFQDFSGHIDRILNVKFNRSRDLLITTSANEVFVWKLGFN